MRFYDQLPAIFGSTILASAIIITLPQAVVALTGKQVNDIAREVTVLIASDKGHGSGVIISKDGNSYYILTADHVVRESGDYKVVTPDKQTYEIDYGKIQHLPGVDLAVVAFTSKKNYQVAKLANAQLASEGQEVFVSGWPALGAVGQAAGGQLIRQFTDGRISGFLEKPLMGYKMIYTNVTRAGMSGGPVLDSGGRVIAIHGLGDKEDATQLMAQGFTQEAATSIANQIKPGFNYAIPINTYLQLAPQAGIYLGVQVENSPAPEITAPYVANAQPDKRDTIDDINATLNSVTRITDTIDRGANTIDRGVNTIDRILRF